MSDLKQPQVAGYSVAQNRDHGTVTTKIKIALDWTPNTIHSGLFLAQKQGFYEAEGLDVDIYLPDASYSPSPARRLQSGEVDLAICPSESIIAYAESAKPNFKLQAIYALLQKGSSAIVTLEDRFNELSSLESAVYGSYSARYEDQVVRAMINAAGGDGSRLRIDPTKRKLKIFEELKQGTIDAAWVFMPWEGVQAQCEGIALHAFWTEDVGIPYGYSPLIARNAFRSLPDGVLLRFVRATRKGYELAMSEPDFAVRALGGKCEPAQSGEFLKRSQDEVNKFYSDGSQLGVMKEERWRSWLEWLMARQLVTTELSVEELFTNQFHE